MSMFSFQAIHNQKITTEAAMRLFIDYVNVLFSSNSQQHSSVISRASCCLSIMSMFSFQAIHNLPPFSMASLPVVYRLCQCSLFKQFTTDRLLIYYDTLLFIDYVNVLFSSNSQRNSLPPSARSCCLSIMSMFSFQAIHNCRLPQPRPNPVVYRLCQCSLFKQFTTGGVQEVTVRALFIDYVNVLFSSNSQRTISFYFSMQRYDFFRTVPNLFFKGLKDKHFTF